MFPSPKQILSRIYPAVCSKTIQKRKRKKAWYWSRPNVGNSTMLQVNTFMHDPSSTRSPVCLFSGFWSSFNICYDKSCGNVTDHGADLYSPALIRHCSCNSLFFDIHMWWSPGIISINYWITSLLLAPCIVTKTGCACAIIDHACWVMVAVAIN